MVLEEWSLVQQPILWAGTRLRIAALSRSARTPVGVAVAGKSVIVFPLHIFSFKTTPTLRDAFVHRLFKRPACLFGFAAEPRNHPFSDAAVLGTMLFEVPPNVIRNVIRLTNPPWGALGGNWFLVSG